MINTDYYSSTVYGVIFNTSQLVFVGGASERRNARSESHFRHSHLDNDFDYLWACDMVFDFGAD